MDNVIDPKIVHQGRGGYIEVDGFKYQIEHIHDGHFCIHFPSGNRHDKLGDHFKELEKIAQAHAPQWYIEKEHSVRIKT